MLVLDCPSCRLLYVTVSRLEADCFGDSTCPLVSHSCSETLKGENRPFGVVPGRVLGLFL